MWILEHEGKLLDGKRLWLRPGRSYLFGRTMKSGSPDQRSWQINEKSVSRKHVVISIAPVKPGQGSQPAHRSSISVLDDSKIGTFVDEQQIPRQQQHALDGTCHTIRLGNWQQKFIISWHPVCISVQISPKQWRAAKEASKDPLAPYHQRFEQLDVKVLPDYSIEYTTHLVSGKRNVPRSLQALINAKYVVTEDFLNDVAQAAASPGFEEDGVTPLPAPLETDFDRNWPDAMRHLPAPGKEPHPRPADKFAPDPSRIDIFKGFNFVFADRNQYESLMHPLTNGQAKCELREVTLGQTSVKDFVAQVREIALHRGERLGEFASKTHAGVAVVRFRGIDDTAEWALDFLRRLDLELGQRSAEQNEFLDAILMNDTRQLRQPLREEEYEVPSTAPARQSTARHSTPEQAPAPPTNAPSPQPKEPPSSAQKPTHEPPASTSSQAPKRRRVARTATAPRFRGFDDFEDDDFKPKRSPSPVPEEPASLAAPTSAQIQADDDMASPPPDSQSLFVPEAPRLGKRKAPAPEELDKHDQAQQEIDDTLLPGAAAMKKRRLEQQAAGITPAPAPAKPARPAPKPKRELDVRGTAQAHARAMDRQVDTATPAAANSKSSPPPDPADDDISQLRNLALVEDMPLRATPATAPAAAHDARWKPEWNGRKNFKAFRRHGAPSAERGISKVMVALEEVRRNDFGLGDDGWIDVAAPRRGDAGAARQSGSQARTARGQRLQRGGEKEVEAAGIVQISDDDEEVSRTVRSQRRGTQRQASPAAPTGSKRPADASASRATPPKRTRQTRLRPVDDSDDDDNDDDMKFRFRSRKR